MNIEETSISKAKEKQEKYDARGVQTLFRTLSRNHYNLLRMVDNKASIILTVNSIIISLIMGAMYIAPDSRQGMLQVISQWLINCSLVSMILAVISMLPHRYIGPLFKASSYKGTLYAGNFYKLSLEEFKMEFDRIVSTGNSVYNEMLHDLYFLGKTIDGKQRMVWISTAIFLIGLIGTFAYGVYNSIFLN